MIPHRSLRYVKYKLQKSLKERGLGGTFDACKGVLWGTCKASILRARESKASEVICEVIRSLTPQHRRLTKMEREFDREHGVKTAGYIRLKDLDVSTREFRNNYQATPVSALQRILSCLYLAHEDFVFIDLGSGMGRAVLAASEFPFKKIIGVEFSSELHRIAEENVLNFRSVNQKCRNIELVCMDAVEYPVPVENTVFYLFQPFQKPIMARVLENIRRSLEAHPREIVIAYHLLPHDLLEMAPFLERMQSGEARFVTHNYMRVEQRPFAIYRNKTPAGHGVEERRRTDRRFIVDDKDI